MSGPGISTVHVVDDDRAILDSLTALFESVGLGVRVYDAPEKFLEGDIPDRGCLVTDLRMPGMSGFELVKRVRERAPDLPVLFITGHGEVPLAVRAMKDGAVDFLEKPVRHQELLARVQEAIRRGDEGLADRKQQHEMAARLSRLTDREREVLSQVAAGRTSRQIAEALRISLKTVEVHRSRIMEKMQARNVADLVRRVAVAGVKPEQVEDPTQ
jgi:RNA polymerase sigma factor (sigma-70 family)